MTQASDRTARAQAARVPRIARLLAALALLCAGGAPLAAQYVPEPSDLDVTHYEAHVGFDLGREQLSGEVYVHLRNAGTGPMDTVRLHLRDLAVSSVHRTTQPLVYTQAGGELAIALDAALAPGDSTVLSIVYGGRATDEGGFAWGGCFWGTPAFAMGVGFRAPYVSMLRHWLPSHDVPWDKASFDLTYIVPEGYVAAGTGTLASVTHGNGSTEYRWVEPHPTATYLVTYAIDRYAVVKDAWRGLPLEYYVPRADSVRGVTHFATVPSMLDAFAAAYGPYPFDKAGYCITPIGSMEHQTMISYDASLFGTAPASTVAAHELAHMWWGDCVTPADFREAWLSEGFATFSEAVWAGHVKGRAEYLRTAARFASTYRSQVEMAEGTFALYDFPRTSPSSNYPSTIYQKGAAVLVMLREVMGDSLFFAGMRTHQARYRYGNATTREFQASMEEQYGASLDWFFTPWVFHPSYPTYRVTTIVDAGDRPFSFYLTQGQDTTRFPLIRMPIEVWAVTKTGDTLRARVMTEAARDQEVVPFPGVMTSTLSKMLFDPLNLILKRVQYGTVKAEAPPAPAQGVLLEPAYPHPAAGGHGATTWIPFRLDRPGHVRIDLCDMLGRTVATPSDATWSDGRHVVAVDTAGLPSGTYTVLLRGAGQVRTQALVITR